MRADARKRCFVPPAGSTTRYCRLVLVRRFFSPDLDTLNFVSVLVGIILLRSGTQYPHPFQTSVNATTQPKPRAVSATLIGPRGLVSWSLLGLNRRTVPLPDGILGSRVGMKVTNDPFTGQDTPKRRNPRKVMPRPPVEPEPHLAQKDPEDTGTPSAQYSYPPMTSSPVCAKTGCKYIIARATRQSRLAYRVPFPGGVFVPSQLGTRPYTHTHLTSTNYRLPNLHLHHQSVSCCATKRLVEE